MLLETLMSDPDSVQKALLHPAEGFLCFSGPCVGGSAVWGAPHHRALVALGRSWRICQRTHGEPAEPNLSAYARQPARGPTMLAHLLPMLASCWPMLSRKIRKMVTAKKHCKTQDILMVGGLSWGYVGPSWGYVGLSWGQCGPILGLCWPILELCWPIGAMLAHLGGYVGPSWGYVGHLEAYGPMLTHLEHKIRKIGKTCWIPQGQKTL